MVLPAGARYNRPVMRGFRRGLPLLLAISALLFALSAAPPAGQAQAAARYLVVIDPGHGGQDPGGIGWLGVKEKDVNLAIARLVELEALNEPHLKIVLTRRNDIYISLRERVALAERLGAALYVSIHANIHRDPWVRGTETLLPESWRGGHSQSLRLAQKLQHSLVRWLGTRDRGVKYQRLYLRWADLPAALVEVGFLSNPEEARLLQTLSYQDRVAKAILAAIKEFLGLR